MSHPRIPKKPLLLSLALLVAVACGDSASEPTGPSPDSPASSAPAPADAPPPEQAVAPPSSSVLATESEVGLSAIRELFTTDPDGMAEVGLTASDVPRLTVGAPLEGFELAPRALARRRAGQPISELIESLHTLYVPVLLDGEVRLLAWIAATPEGWRFTGFGQAALGPALTTLLGDRGAAGAAPRIVFQDQTRRVFALVNDTLVDLAASPSLARAAFAPSQADVLDGLAKAVQAVDLASNEEP